MIFLDLPSNLLLFFVKVPLMYHRVFQSVYRFDPCVVKDYMTRPGTQNLRDLRKRCKALQVLAESAAPTMVL